MSPRHRSHEGKGLNLYYTKLSRKVDPFPCPHCRESISYRHFESHCSERHGLNARLCCVWCDGRERWPGREKRMHLHHLLSCRQSFASRNPPDTSPLSDTKPRPFDSKPTHPKRSLFDHRFDPPPLRAHDPVWPMPLDPLLLTLRDDSLNRAASTVRKYLELGSEAEWFHAMVRTVAYPNFLEAMDRDEGRSRTLSFSCWCDGGTPEEARHRQHRHMLVVSSPRGHFERNVWKRIATPPRHLLPHPNFKCVHLETVRDVMHLVNAIGYVSNRKSRCMFSGTHNRKGKEKNNHFYLFETLPRDYRLPLVLQWDGGFLQLLDQDFRNMKRIDLVRSPLEFEAQKWRLRIKNIPGIDPDTVLPVSRDFRPCTRPTPHLLHLSGGRKMYFERHPPLLDPNRETWLQTEPGNLFLRAAGDDLWTPRPYHQGLVHEFKPLVDRVRELEREAEKSARDKGEMERLREECARSREESRVSEQSHWKRADELHREIDLLHREIHRLNRVEIARMKRETEESKRELADATRENEELKRELEASKREAEKLKLYLNAIVKRKKPSEKEDGKL